MTSLIVIVNESPWGSSLALSALRFVQSAIGSGVQVPGICFREDGIYNAVAGEVCDAGTPDLAHAWADTARSAGTRLLMCTSSRQRRLVEPPAKPFEDSGLAEMLEMIITADRVVTF